MSMLWYLVLVLYFRPRSSPLIVSTALNLLLIGLSQVAHGRLPAVYEDVGYPDTP